MISLFISDLNVYKVITFQHYNFKLTQIKYNLLKFFLIIIFLTQCYSKPATMNSKRPKKSLKYKPKVEKLTTINHPMLIVIYSH